MAEVNTYLDIKDLNKSIGDLILFENASLSIAERQRIGIIGRNGTGKSTLLNIISGKEGYDSGEVVFRRGIKVGFLEQSPESLAKQLLKHASIMAMKKQNSYTNIWNVYLQMTIPGYRNFRTVWTYPTPGITNIA